MKLKSLMIFLTTNITIHSVNQKAFKLVEALNIRTKEAQNKLNINADSVKNNLKNDTKKIVDGLIQILLDLDPEKKDQLLGNESIVATENNKNTKKSLFSRWFFFGKKEEKSITEQPARTLQVIRNINYYNSMMQNLQEKHKIMPLLCALALKSEGIHLNETAIKKYVEFLDLFFVEYRDVLTEICSKYLFAVSIARIFDNANIDFVWFCNIRDRKNHLRIDNLVPWFNTWYQDCKKNSILDKQLLEKFDDSIKKCQKWRNNKVDLSTNSYQIAYVNSLNKLLDGVSISENFKNEIINIIDNRSQSDFSNHVLQMLIIYELINSIPAKSLDYSNFDIMFNKMVEVKAAQIVEQEIDKMKLVKKQFRDSKPKADNANGNEYQNSERSSVAESSSWDSSELPTLDDPSEYLGSDDSSN